MATVTAGDMVRDALGLLLVLGQQDTLAAADMDDGLRFPTRCLSRGAYPPEHLQR